MKGKLMAEKTEKKTKKNTNWNKGTKASNSSKSKSSKGASRGAQGKGSRTVKAKGNTKKTAKNTNTQKKSVKKEVKKVYPHKLKNFALGGLNEIGKNITVYEYDNEIILVDCGLAFPDPDMLGVDLVLPDFSYLENSI